jgi:hypothetical protein
LPGPVARIEREREELEARLRLVELEAALENERLARLEERLRRYPLAAHWELEQARLAVARSLAGNTRAILPVDSDGAVGNVLALRDLLREADAPEPSAQAANGAGEGGGQREHRPGGSVADDSVILRAMREQAEPDE